MNFRRGSMTSGIICFTEIYILSGFRTQVNGFDEKICEISSDTKRLANILMADLTVILLSTELVIKLSGFKCIV